MWPRTPTAHRTFAELSLFGRKPQLWRLADEADSTPGDSTGVVLTHSDLWKSYAGAGEGHGLCRTPRARVHGSAPFGMMHVLVVARLGSTNPVNHWGASLYVYLIDDTFKVTAFSSRISRYW